YGKVIKELTEDQIKKVPVPIVDRSTMTQINAIMLRAATLYDTARQSLLAAEDVLIRLLALSKDIMTPDVWIGTNSNSYLKASGDLLGHRLDPHFYAPIANHLRHRLREKEHKPLKRIA